MSQDTSPLRQLQPVYRSQEIRAIEHHALALQPPPPLMQRAGIAAAHVARDMLVHGKRVLVFAGPGNNGGDAWVCARQLRDWWFDVQVVFLGDAKLLSADALSAMQSWTQASGAWTPNWNTIARKPDLIIDGLLGIGMTREVSGPMAAAIQWINEAAVPVLALDTPSGLNADTGRVMGCAVRATRTITFLGLKPGLLTLDGPDHAGQVGSDRLQLDTAAFELPHGQVLDASLLDAFPKRVRNSHKGTFGSVGVIGGAHGMIGAAILAARAALHIGAGRVYVGFVADDAPVIDWVHPELMIRAAEEAVLLDHASCIALGPGAGQSPRAARLLDASIARPIPIVLDADALNLVAIDPVRASAVRSRKAPTVITPHPAEAARLLGKNTSEIQADRIAAACELASKLNSHVVLKGVGSVCALPNQRWFINASGNPGLAVAGMGDVLCGIVAALIAQGIAPSTALLMGVYLHGAAADCVLATRAGPIGMTANEVIIGARELLNAHVYAPTPTRAP